MKEKPQKLLCSKYTANHQTAQCEDNQKLLCIMLDHRRPEGHMNESLRLNRISNPGFFYKKNPSGCLVSTWEGMKPWVPQPLQ